MSLSPNEMHDKVSTQFFEGGDSVGGKVTEPYPRWSLKGSKECPTYNLIWDPL